MTPLSTGRSRKLAIAGLAVTVLIVNVGVAGASDLGGSHGSMTLYADTADAGALIKGNDVRIFGVKVGTVRNTAVVKNSAARLTLALDSSTPIHSDATLTVRPVSLLGERYVDLAPGSAQAPAVHSGYTFPASQSSRSVDLDEVLNTVNQPTGTALQLLVQTLGAGLQANGAHAAGTVSALAPSMQQTDGLVRVLDQQTATLQQLVSSLGPVVAALGDANGSSTDKLLDSATTVLGATARQQQALQAALDQLPATLGSAQSALAKLSGLSDQATPALASVQPFTSKLSQISGQLTQFSAAARPAIATLKPVLDQARLLVAQATPLVQQLAASSPAMRADAANGSAFLTDLSTHISSLLDFITFWTLTTNGQDGLSHYFRVQMIASGDTVTSHLPASPANAGNRRPTAPAAAAASAPASGGVTGLTQGLTGLTQGLGAAIGELPNGIDPQSATGLTSGQEKNLLSFLLGGSR
jgi:phospholipid/cholesterol/gamma-HCH transport system substrate-binding protein